ncbi:hypothetical protein L5163_004723 [Vibrio parahaemolyticus]|nr:hypothetical protein [Vibrio parahaemolyticus]
MTFNPNLIQFGVLLVALFSLIWQQRRAFIEGQKKEKRVETKLKIFYALSQSSGIDLSEQDIIYKLEQNQPLGEADKVEVRKALYEMLAERTVRFTKKNEYRPRQGLTWKELADKNNDQSSGEGNPKGKD